MRVSTRIALGFAMLVALGLGVAGFGVAQLAGVGVEVGRMTILATNMRRVLEAEHLIERMSRAETRYRLDADAASVDVWDDGHARTRTLLAELVRDAVAEDRRKIYAEVLAGMDGHRESFLRYVASAKAALDARNRLYDGGEVLKAATAKLVEVAKSAPDPALARQAVDVANKVVLTPIANWRFVATSEPGGPARFRAAADEAHAAVAFITQTSDAAVNALAGPLQDALDRYAGDFTAYSVATLKSVAT